jgi:hypothetical protein
MLPKCRIFNGIYVKAQTSDYTWRSKCNTQAMVLSNIQKKRTNLRLKKLSLNFPIRSKIAKYDSYDRDTIDPAVFIGFGIDVDSDVVQVFDVELLSPFDSMLIVRTE